MDVSSRSLLITSHKSPPSLLSFVCLELSRAWISCEPVQLFHPVCQPLVLVLVGRTACSGNGGLPAWSALLSLYSSSPSPPPLLYLSSSLQTGTGAGVATDRQLNMQQHTSADTDVLAASIRKGRAAFLKKRFQAEPNHEHKAVDPIPSSSSSAVSNNPNPSPLFAIPSISSVHCGVLCLDSTKFSSLRNNPSAITPWVQSHYPNVSSHSTVDHHHQVDTFISTFALKPNSSNAMSCRSRSPPSNRLLRCFGFSPAPCSGKKFPESIKCTVVELFT